MEPKGTQVLTTLRDANMTNELIARRLQLEAREMEVKPTLAYSARAYRLAADTITRTDLSVQDLFEQGGPDLIEGELHGVGRKIAERISGYLRFEKTLQLLRGQCAVSVN
jgi:DNA polymerase/3'-5' exonuclease PolX